MEPFRRTARWLTAVLVAAALVATLPLAGCDDQTTAPTPPGEEPSATPPTPPPSIVLSGIVRETAPTQDRRIAGATITTLLGPRSESTVSDANGHFTLRPPRGTVRIAVSAPAYDPREWDVTIDEDREIAFDLMPTFREVHELWSTQCCNGNYGQGVRFSFPVHHPGQVRIRASVCTSGCSASEVAWTCVELRDDTGAVIDREPRGDYDHGVITTMEVVGGHRYELTVSDCYPTRPPGWFIKAYNVDLLRPN
jgi:hypothetical protein